MGPIHLVWALAAIHPRWGKTSCPKICIDYKLPLLGNLKSWYPDLGSKILVPIGPPQVDSSKGPNRVNRAPWPTKENMHSFVHFGPWRKWLEMAQNGVRNFFFGPIQTLPTFWATGILILIISFLSFMDSKFLDFQVPRFPKSGPGRAWARPGLGLSHLD